MSDDIIERLGDFWPDDPADRKLIADSMREIERLRAEVERLTKERDEVSSVLAAHSGKGSAREWHQGGAWLYPGDKIVVVVVEDAP